MLDIFSSLALRAALGSQHHLMVTSDEEPESLGRNMTYPRSPPGGDVTLSKPHYLPEPPASSYVK